MGEPLRTGSRDQSGPRKLSRRKLLLGLSAAGLAFLGLTIQFLLDQLMWIETPPRAQGSDARPHARRPLLSHGQHPRTRRTRQAVRSCSQFTCSGLTPA